MKLAIIGCALVLVGCAQFDTGSVAQRTAARLLECPERNVELHQLGAYRYRAEGCGRALALACTATQLEPQCLRESELASAGGAAGGEEPTPPPIEASEAGETSEVEARIRAGLDARSEDVLACVGRDRVAVRVGYAPDGSVDITLQGALHDTPEERCIQDALDGVRVPATGASGVVVHLIHAAP